MAKDLEKYNHLKYGTPSNESTDDFVEFLFQNTDLSAPEINEDLAWNKVRREINDSKKSFNWLRIAASVAIILSVSFAIYLTNKTEEIFIASTDQKVNVTFPDGSIGVLNEESSFTFLEEFGNERRVSFNGEAYFDIIKSEKPFIIDANGVEVKVLGTAFNLITDENQVSLFVDRGLVAFSKDGEETKVKAGLEAVFNKKTNSVTIKETPSDNIMSWRSGYFEFDETPLEEALVDLSEFYEVDFKLTNTKLNSCRISATFDNDSLKDVLNTLESILNVKTNYRDSTVKISGKGC